MFDFDSLAENSIEEIAHNTYQYEDLIGVYGISASGFIQNPSVLEQAVTVMKQYGFDLSLDPHALDRLQRFAGTDEIRASAFTRAVLQEKPIVMATRGGYGLSRILGMIDWPLLEKNPKIFCGFSDFTAFNLALLAKTGLPSFSGPNIGTDFHLNSEPFNAELFTETMRHELEVLTFASPYSPSVDEKGIMWGGNLCVLTTLLGTPYFPQIEGGILFLEDVGEHPYRIERCLTSLWHAGVLDRQKVIVLGDFTNYQLADNDIQYDLDTVIQWLRDKTKTPVVTGLPYGHGTLRATLPVGQEVGIAVQEDTAYIVLEEHDHTLGFCACPNCMGKKCFY